MNFSFHSLKFYFCCKYIFSKSFILSILKDKIITIEHVGSTSVPGMRAKPIVDAVVVIDPFVITEHEKQIFKERGYHFSVDVVAKNSVLLEKGLESEKTENIHILPKDHFMIKQMVLSRDYLRNHPERVKEYSKLKDELKKEYPDDYKLYRKGKTSFMDETEELAYKEFGK